MDPTTSVDDVPVTATPTKVTPSVLSKKRFQQIREAASEFVSDEAQVELLMQRIATIMKFDPDIGIYTPERGQRTIRSLHKRMEATGLSSYVLTGGKKRYENSKTT